MDKYIFIPALRFQGFQSNYFTTNVESIASFIKGRGYTKKDLINNGNPIIMYGQLYTDYSFTIENVNRFVELQNGSIISKGNEVIIPASGETSEDIARASAVIEPGIILGGDLNVITPSEEINPSYLAMNLSSLNPKKQMMNKAQGKSIVHLQNDDIKKVVIHYPSKDEQIKVSQLISKVEENICLKNIEILKLQNFKQAMLQKMFPKEGETVPEVRFDDFEGNWEKYELREIADIVGGGTPSTTNSAYWNGAINWYSPVEIGNKTYVDASQNKITKLGLESSSAKILPVGTVLFTSRAGIGKTAILAKEGATNQGFQSIIPHKNVLDSYFIYSKTNELKRYGENKGAGSTFVEVSGKQMGKMPLLIPTIDEQKQIGYYFKKIDQNIQAKQTQLTKLKQFKQAMLNKMFV